MVQRPGREFFDRRSTRGGLVAALALVAACGSGPTEPRRTDPTPTPVEPTPAPTLPPVEPTPTPFNPFRPEPCNADPDWIEEPRIPLDVPNIFSCQFHQFSWQDFLALSAPAEEDRLVFETYMPKAGVFEPSVYDPERGDEPYPWGTELPVPPDCPDLPGTLFQLIEKGAPVEAGSNAAPLVDQHGRWLHYGIRMNERAYDYLTSCDLYRIGCFNDGVAGEDIQFPEESILLKTSWRIVDAAEAKRDPPRYHIVRALVDPLGPTEDESGCQAVFAALVGFHIVHKTPIHPEWIWATFEHRDLAPDCATTSAVPSDGWLLYDPGCDGDFCTENRFNNTCSSNECSDIASFECGLDLDRTCEEVATCDASDPCRGCWDAACTDGAIPTQACRDFPLGWSIDNEGGGIVDSTLAELNESARAMLAERGSVWQHYQLAGTLWCTPPGIPGMGGMQCSKAGPLTEADQIGMLALSNISMETYNQRLNCFSCHNGSFAPSSDAFPQADFSHLFADMTTEGGCGETADFCPGH